MAYLVMTTYQYIRNLVYHDNAPYYATCNVHTTPITRKEVNRLGILHKNQSSQYADFVHVWREQNNYIYGGT